MSFYDDASLVFLPSGGAGKDGKAYSMKPTNGDGDFTFSRGSNLTATRVDSNGLIEKGRENLLTYSNDFSQWINSNATETSGQSGYDGSSDAWLITSTTNSTSVSYQNKVTSSVSTISLRVKSASTNWLAFRIKATNGSAWFNLSTGSFSTIQANVIHTNVVDLGNGWYKISLTSTSSEFIAVYPCNNDNTFNSTIGNSIYIQDAQLEQGLVATEYIESGATTGKAGILEDSPRFDYSGGASCPSLLLEPSRTNLSSSEYFEQFWSTSSGGTRVYNQITSPEGIQNGTKIYPTSTGSFKGLSKAFGSTLSNTPYALSIFAKAGEFEHLYFYNVGSPNGNNGVWFNLTTGSVGTNQNAWTSAKIEDFGNGWYRCSAVITTGGTSDNLYILLSDSNGSVTATTSGTDGLYIYGAQLEEGSYPTSYMPNHSGGSVTRNADSMQSDTSSFGITNEFTLFIDTNGALVDGTSLNQMDDLRWYTQSTNRYRFYKPSNVIFISNNIQVDDRTKIALKITATECKTFVDGVLDSTISLTTPFASFDSISRDMETKVKEELNQILLFPSALSNTDCEILTGTSYESFAAMATALNYTTYE